MARGRQSFLSGAAILSAAVAITKVLGALYKIPLGNLLGSEGMAHYYAAYSVFNVAAMFCAGIPVAMSRTVSQCCALGKREAARRTFFTGLFWLSLFGIAGTLFMYFFAPSLAELLHDPAALPAIRTLSPALLTMNLCGAVRGYTQGQGDMRPTAVSQILESAGKLTVGLGVCVFLLRRDCGVEVSAAGALTGVVAGGIFAAGYLASFLRKVPKKEYGQKKEKYIPSKLLGIAFPITIGAAGMSILTLLDQSLVLRTLQHTLHYTAQQASAAYGEYTFSMTLFVLAPSLIVPVSAALMPCISGASAAGNRGETSYYIRQALRLAAAAGIPLGVGMSCLARPILTALYPAQLQAAQAAAWHLRILGIAAVFVGLSAVCGGVLQACGKAKIPLLALTLGGTVKILCDIFLVAREDIAVRGVSIGTLGCYVVICAVELYEIRKCSGNEKACWSLFLRPGLSAVTMAMAVQAMYGLLEGKWPQSLACAAAALYGAAVYVTLLLALGGITVREVKKLLPQRHTRRKFI